MVNCWLEVKCRKKKDRVQFFLIYFVFGSFIELKLYVMIRGELSSDADFYCFPLAL